jgi:putative methyltransferase (TIGR04325 family)
MIALGLSTRPKRELNVIDFGGACGAHYFLAKMVFGRRFDLRWHVVETPGIVLRARELEDGTLKFYDRLTEARSELGHVDLIFSSSALQYVPEPYAFMEELAKCGADNIYLTKIGLSALPIDLISIQKSRLSENGPGPLPKGITDREIRYPVTFPQKQKLESIIKRDYAIQILFEEYKGAYRAGRHAIDMFGYYCTLKPAFPRFYT